MKLQALYSDWTQPHRQREERKKTKQKKRKKTQSIPGNYEAVKTIFSCRKEKVLRTVHDCTSYVFHLHIKFLAVTAYPYSNMKA